MKKLNVLFVLGMVLLTVAVGFTVRHFTVRNYEVKLEEIEIKHKVEIETMEETIETLEDDNAFLRAVEARYKQVNNNVARELTKMYNGEAFRIDWIYEDNQYSYNTYNKAFGDITKFMLQ